MKHYEVLTIVPGTFTEGEVTEVIGRVQTVIANTGISDVTVDNRGKSRLSYPMNHIRYGFYQYVQFAAEPEQVIAIQKGLGLMSELLRAVVSAYDPKRRAVSLVAREARRAAMGARGNRPSRNEETDEEPEVPVPAARILEPVAAPELEEIKKVDIEEIDKKLDEMLATDLERI